MQWTNIVLWSLSLAVAVSLILSVVTRRERSLIEVLRDLVVASNPPDSNLADPNSPDQTAASNQTNDAASDDNPPTTPNKSS